MTADSFRILYEGGTGVRKGPVIYALSDSIGETAELVARATASQFESGDIDIIRVPYISSIEQIENVFQAAEGQPAMICHTIVSPDLRVALEKLAAKMNITTVDIMGPMIGSVQAVTGFVPKLKPGLIHQLNQEYFKRVEAIEFAVKYDDGKNPNGLLKADIVLIGVSRTSKTPLSMYLAHKRFKAANVPLVPEVCPPPELFEVPSDRIVGLVLDPLKLNEIRAERLRIMGLAPGASYASVDRIIEELSYARSVMNKIGCPVIDVSNKAIEETANRIIEIIRSKK